MSFVAYMGDDVMDGSTLCYDFEAYEQVPEVQGYEEEWNPIFDTLRDLIFEYHGERLYPGV